MLTIVGKTHGFQFKVVSLLLLVNPLAFKVAYLIFWVICRAFKVVYLLLWATPQDV